MKGEREALKVDAQEDLGQIQERKDFNYFRCSLEWENFVCSFSVWSFQRLFLFEIYAVRKKDNNELHEPQGQRGFSAAKFMTSCDIFVVEETWSR